MLLLVTCYSYVHSNNNKYNYFNYNTKNNVTHDNNNTN